MRSERGREGFARVLHHLRDYLTITFKLLECYESAI